MEIPTAGLRLNVGCGRRRFAGWVGVDVAPQESVDVVAEMWSIPLPDQCAIEIMAIHSVEHIYAWQVPDALAEWFRLLRHSGKLVLEMPDLLKACKNIAEGYRGGKHPDQQQMWAIFGDEREKDPLMIHKSGWWFDRLKPLVEAAGFSRITEHQTEWHAVGRERRDFRLEAYRA